MIRLTVEEMNLLSIYHEGSKAQLMENMTAALPFMDDPDQHTVARKLGGRVIPQRDQRQLDHERKREICQNKEIGRASCRERV